MNSTSVIIIIYATILFSVFSQQILIAGDILTPSQSISDGQTLLSEGGTFELGFFSPSTSSTNRYVGIWYKAIPSPPVVWVANRDSPLNDTSGVLKIDTNGNIVIVGRAGVVVWSSNSSVEVENPIVEFLRSGNLVLRDERDRDLRSYVWQSFDYPGDTILPGMKFGWNLKTGMNRYMSSWKNTSDPSRGDLTYAIDLTGYLDMVIRNGSAKLYRIRPWNAVRSRGAPDIYPGSVFTYEYVITSDEIYFIYQVINQSVGMRVVLMQTGSEGEGEGVLQHLTWVERTRSWVSILSIPRDRCDAYALCGSYGFCDTTSVPICKCLRGCKPKSVQEWSATDWSNGCVRLVPVNCSRGEGFIRYSATKLPDTTGSWVNSSMNLDECRQRCLNNCSCTAYSNSDVSGRNTGCITWSTELVDIRQLNDGGQDLYVRMAASALDEETEGESGTKNRVILIVSLTSIASIILLVTGFWWIQKRKTPKGGGYIKREHLELPIYDLDTISDATNCFSYQNKLGEGGFGPVYRGTLDEGQEIAVKRLSTESTQGADEFKNEVLLISKLQHKNLVRLLGCCIQGKEKMLVYEYMQNRSLDSFIFDKTRGRVLDWNMRFKIIDGIARGLLYLHHDSRLRIIHRDLKASNILLDDEMVPKISDFGLARIVGGDEFQAQTKRVVGTYGYMAPEYAVDGHFSVKSDVFSFGVLALEIISGKKNRGFAHSDHALNLLGHAWRLWNEDKSRELVDNSLGDLAISEDVLRCIHIGLLCVQKVSEQRPTMSVVVSMLSSEDVTLPTPQEPGFYVERSTSIGETESVSFISNDVTITTVEAR